MNTNPTFNFELTLEEANVILAALQEIPAKLCNPVSEKLKSQAQQQIADKIADMETEEAE